MNQRTNVFPDLRLNEPTNRVKEHLHERMDHGLNKGQRDEPVKESAMGEGEDPR
jgi:hypothetical protein